MDWIGLDCDCGRRDKTILLAANFSSLHPSPAGLSTRRHQTTFKSPGKPFSTLILPIGTSSRPYSATFSLLLCDICHRVARHLGLTVNLVAGAAASLSLSLSLSSGCERATTSRVSRPRQAQPQPSSPLLVSWIYSFEPCDRPSWSFCFDFLPRRHLLPICQLARMCVFQDAFLSQAIHPVGRRRRSSQRSPPPSPDILSILSCYLKKPVLIVYNSSRNQFIA